MNKTIQSNKFIVHSFSSPVTNLILNLEVLSEELKENPFLTSAIKSAKYLEELLNTLRQDKKNIFLLKDQLENLKTIISKKDISLNIKTKNIDKIYLNLNKSLFTEMLICLINNAYESYKLKEKKKLVKINVKGYKNHIIIKIIDHGKGISLFKRFILNLKNISFKKNHYGIGLKFIKEFVKSHNGSFKLKSKKNKGTTITIILPATKA